MPYPNNNMEGSDRLTIREAAALLGVHPNTVRNRIKDGTYKAQKMVTANGTKYYIERDSLVNNLNAQRLPQGSQQALTTNSASDLEALLTMIVKANEENSERENKREADKIRVQGVQTQVIVSAGLIAAMGAVVSFIPEPTYLNLIYSAFGLFLGAVMIGLNVIRAIAEELYQPGITGIFTSPRIWYFISSLCFFLGLMASMWFIILNT